MKTRPYGVFPSKRQNKCDHDPEPEPEDGPYKRYFGACANVPTDAEGIRLLQGMDCKATGVLKVSSSGTNSGTPYYAFACPVEYGTIKTMKLGGLDSDYDSSDIEVDGVAYRVVSTPYKQFSPISVAVE